MKMLLMKLREKEANLLSDIQGTMAALRNLQSQIIKLQQELSRQQELLYSAEFQIQLLERKVARANGEKTSKETTKLGNDIKAAQDDLDSVLLEKDNLVRALKTLAEEKRNLEKKIKSDEETRSKYTTLIEKLNLENDMTVLELNKIIKDKENSMVQHDIMKLEIMKIQSRLKTAQDEVLSLDNKKNQLELGLAEREKEVMVHRGVLTAEFKAAEQERHKIAVELAKRENIVKNNKIKFQSLVQRKQGSNGMNIHEHSQAYYMIKAGQEREELQRKEDELNAQIAKSCADLNALNNTRLQLINRNSTYKDYFINRGWTEKDVEQKANLDDQLKVAGDNLIKKRTEFQRLKSDIDENQKSFNENQNRLDVLLNRSQKAEGELSRIVEETNKQREKLERAEKFLKKANDDIAKKNIDVDDSNHQLVLARLEEQSNTKKTLQSIIQ